MVDTLILDIKQAMSSTLTNGQMEKLHKVLAHYLYDLEIIKKEEGVSRIAAASIMFSKQGPIFLSSPVAGFLSIVSLWVRKPALLRCKRF